MTRRLSLTLLALACACGGSPPAVGPPVKEVAAKKATPVAEPSAPAPVPTGEETPPPLSAIDGLDDGVLRRWGGGRLHLDVPSLLFLSSEREPIVFDVERETGSTAFELERGETTLGRVVVSSKSFIRHYEVSGNLDRLVTSDDEATTVWEMKTGASRATNAGLTGPFAFAASSIVGMRGKDLVAWDPASNATRVLASMRGYVSSVTSGGSAIAALEVRDNKPARDRTDHLWLFDLEAGTKRTMDLGAHRSDRGYAIDPDGAFALVARGRVFERVDLASSDPPEEILSLDPDPRGWGGPTFVVGRQVAAAASTDGIVLFDPWSGNVRRALAVDGPRRLALSSDGRTLAALTSVGDVLRFELPSGEEIPPAPGHSWVGAADVDPGTRRAVTAGTRLELWDVESSERLRQAKPARRLVEAAFLGDAVVTVDVYGSVDRWDLETLRATRWHENHADDYDRARPLLAVDRVRGRAAFALRDREGKYGRTDRVRVVDGDGGEIFALEIEATALAFDEQGRLAVGHEGAVTLYDHQGEPTWRWRNTRVDASRRAPYDVNGIALDGPHLAIESAGFEVWDRERDAMLRGMPSYAAAYAFVGSTLVASGPGGEITSVSLTTTDRKALPPMPSRVVAIRPSARGVLIASENGATVVVDRRWLAPTPAEPMTPQVTLSHAGDVADADGIAILGGYRGLSACVTAQGAVSCWGPNADRELGFGDAVARPQPTPLGVAKVRSLGVGTSFTCALGDDGRPSCWGRIDAEGRISWRAPMSKPAPLAIFAGEALEAFAPGHRGWCAIRSDRRVECLWGDQVAPVVGLRDARHLARGDAHACAIDGSGKVWCWGDNDRGQLGAGRATPEGPAHAVAVEGVSEAVALAAGAHHTCAVARAGTVWCWGAGAHGQLGDGTFASHARATAVRGLTATALAAGGDATCAIARSGTVSCWGAVSGLGAEKFFSTPVAIPGLRDIVTLATTGARSCAVARSGRIDCWGGSQGP